MASNKVQPQADDMRTQSNGPVIVSGDNTVERVIPLKTVFYTEENKNGGPDIRRSKVVENDELLGKKPEERIRQFQITYTEGEAKAMGRPDIQHKVKSEWSCCLGESVGDNQPPPEILGCILSMPDGYRVEFRG